MDAKWYTRCVLLHPPPPRLPDPILQDVAVLRFDMLEKDREPYLSLLRYLVQKHRCGVIGGCHHGIKDFYLVPLVEGKEVAPQLLPFQGPGIF